MQRRFVCSQLAKDEIYYFNNGSDLACITRLTNGPGKVNSVTGWDQTLTIMKRNAIAANPLPAEPTKGALHPL